MCINVRFKAKIYILQPDRTEFAVQELYRNFLNIEEL